MVTPRTLRPFLGALNTSMSVLSPWVRYGRWLATQYRLLLSRQVNRLFLFLPGAEPQDRFLLYKPIQSSKIIKICGILQPSPTSSHFPFVKLVKPRPITGASSSSSGSASSKISSSSPSPASMATSLRWMWMGYGLLMLIVWICLVYRTLAHICTLCYISIFRVTVCPEWHNCPNISVWQEGAGEQCFRWKNLHGATWRSGFLP